MLLSHRLQGLLTKGCSGKSDRLCEDGPRISYGFILKNASACRGRLRFSCICFACQIYAIGGAQHIFNTALPYFGARAVRGTG